MPTALIQAAASACSCACSCAHNVTVRLEQGARPPLSTPGGGPAAAGASSGNQRAAISVYPQAQWVLDSLLCLHMPTATKEGVHVAFYRWEWAVAMGARYICEE